MAGPGGQLCGPDQGAFRERPRAMAGPGGQLCGPDQGAFRERPRAMAGPGGQLCGPDQGAITRKAPRNGGAGGPALRPGSRGHNAKGPAQWRGLPGPICQLIRGIRPALPLHKRPRGPLYRGKSRSRGYPRRPALRPARGQLCGQLGAITRKAPRNGGAGGPALRPGSRGLSRYGPAQWRGRGASSAARIKGP